MLESAHCSEAWQEVRRVEQRLASCPPDLVSESLGKGRFELLKKFGLGCCHSGRFVQGSSIIGANLKRACSEVSWEEQKSIFAGFVLTNAFAIYESWAEQLLNCLNSNLSSKRLQFDDQPGRPGLPSSIATLCANEAPMLCIVYYPVLAADPKYSPALLPNMLKCFRYFKEARNSQMHQGGIASQIAEAAYAAFAPVSDKAALGMRGDLVHDPLIRGQPVRLHLRGVVGFFDIILRMIATVDADLSRASLAENVFANMLREAVPNHTLMSGVASRRIRQIKKGSSGNRVGDFGCILSLGQGLDRDGVECWWFGLPAGDWPLRQ